MKRLFDELAYEVSKKTTEKYSLYKYYISLFAKIRKKSSKEILEHRIRIPNTHKALVAL